MVAGAKFVVAAILTLLILAPRGASGESPQGKSAAEPERPAKEYKQLGDEHVSHERLSDAADAYERALSLGRDTFTLDERVRMAIYISWENRLDSAIDELQRVLWKEPRHIEARIHLARVYSWTGELGKAVAEADEVLRRSPENGEAQLIKADSLGWQGYFKRAIPLYKGILERDNRFDARLGLSYALLDAGNQAEASRNARSLDAASVREKKQLGKLTEAIESAVRPKVDVRYSQYQDSDQNQADRYSLLYGFGLGNQNFALNLKRSDTRGRTGEHRSATASFSMTSNVAEGLRFGAGLGLSRPGSEGGGNFATGQFRFDAAVSNATIGASVGTDILTDTVQLIDNRIRATSYAGRVSKPWSQRFSTSGAYTHQTFSDGNRANSVQFTPQYTIKFVPRFAVGYRFRFLDFHEQSGSGFFDPNGYKSHRLFTSISVEEKRISAYLDVFGGKQSFVRNAYPSNNWILGGSASIGFSPIRQLLLELNGEGGNFDAGTVAGYKYWIAGARVSFRF